MSIYLYSQKINENVKRNIINLQLPEVVARAGPKELTINDYNEAKLIKFCENRKNKDIKVHPYFWNHNYCLFNMLDMEEKFADLVTPDTYLVNSQFFEAGSIIMLVSFFNILSLTYEMTNQDDYEKLLNRLNIDRTIMANFLIDNNFDLPLTDNLLLLIKRIFRNNNIIDFVFTPKLIFSYDQIALILSHFDYGSINQISSNIFDSNLSDKEKLCLCQELIRQYSQPIDADRIIYLKIKNFRPYLCYYLYTMMVEDELANIYYQVWQSFIYNQGAAQLIITDDNKMNEKIQQRYQVIKDYFNL